MDYELRAIAKRLADEQWTRDYVQLANDYHAEKDAWAAMWIREIEIAAQAGDRARLATLRACRVPRCELLSDGKYPVFVPPGVRFQ